MTLARAVRSQILAVTLFIATLVALAAPATAVAGLSSRITTILATHGLRRASTAVRVYDLTDRRALYSFHIDTLLLPASNEKLMTSATALAKWTATHRFKTELWLGAASPDANGVLHGDVYLKGYGDPSLSTAEFQRNYFGESMSSISDFVTELQALGVSKIAGSVVADDSDFDSARVVAAWRPSMTAYCGPLSALTLNEGYGAGGRYVADPSLFAAQKLTSMLRLRGVKVTHSAARGTVPPTAKLYYAEESPNLSRILGAMNKPSDNFFAEELLKGLGADFGSAGTTNAGLKVEAVFLKSLGLPAGSYRLHDGSGLSYTDKLSVRAVTTLLMAMSRRPDYPTYWQSLSVAGVDGTLQDRMRHTAAQGDVHGKTGTLAAASNLSGYVTAANGDGLVFSILMNAPGISVANAQTAQDAIAVALAKSTP